MLAIASAVPAAAETTRYTVSFQGQPSGALSIASEPDSRIVTDFSYRDNGRGPDIREQIKVSADGQLLDYRSDGKSTFGAPIAE